MNQTKPRTKILLCGTIDAQIADCIRSIMSNPQWSQSVSFDLLDDYPVDANLLPFDRFISAETLADDDADACLAPYDVILWIALTPIPQHAIGPHTKDDAMLMKAFHIARLLHRMQNPKTRLLLLTRVFPIDSTSLRKIYIPWQLLCTLFQLASNHAKIIQICPEISRHDAVFLSLFERVLKSNHSPGFDDSDLRWLNILCPIESSALASTLYRAIENREENRETTDSSTEIVLQGDSILSYDDAFEMIRHALKSKIKAIHRLKCLSNSEAQQRCTLLDETLDFHLIDNTQTLPPDEKTIEVRSKIEETAQALLNDKRENLDLCLKPLKHTTTIDDAYCIQRIDAAPKRSLHDTADLFMQWLPSYLKKSLNIEKNNGDRLICKLSNLPLFEIAQTDDAPFFSRLTLQSPYRRHAAPFMTIDMAMLPPQDANQGILLMGCKLPSKSFIFKSIFRRIVAAFGTFTHEYC